MAKETKSIEASMQDLLAKYGRAMLQEQEYISTGSPVLDCVLSNGKGVPLGKMIEISSDSGVGKTSILLSICRYACALGKHVVYLDTESGVNENQLECFGLSEYARDNKFFVFKPVTFDEVEDIMVTILNDPDLAYIILDSITSTVPDRIIEKDKKISEVEPGLHARYCSTFYQKYKGFLEQKNVTMFFVNQTRTKIDFIRGGHIEAAGGQAQKFYMDIRLFLRKKEKLEKKEYTADGEQSVPYGALNSIWSEKNRFARPMIPMDITVVFGKGISNIATYTAWLQKNGDIVSGGGGYFTIKLDIEGFEPQKVRGIPALESWMRSNVALVKSYIDAHGGFFLLKEEEIEQES